jgi:hypothetical protein
MSASLHQLLGLHDGTSAAVPVRPGASEEVFHHPVDGVSASSGSPLAPGRRRGALPGVGATELPYPHRPRAEPTWQP